MTEQKLSLDEMIALAKEFNNKGKWNFLDGDIHADNINELHMWISSQKTKGHERNYSLQLCTCGRRSDDVILVEKYFIDNTNPEEYKKISELYELIKKGAYANQLDEQRRRDAAAVDRHKLIEYRINDAVETAKKLIGKLKDLSIHIDEETTEPKPQQGLQGDGSIYYTTLNDGEK